MRHVMVWVLLLAAVSIGRAETFHVTTNGQDVVTRDGRSEAAAWASLAFACEHLPAGTHTIRIGPGDFTATRTSHLPAGVTVVGNGSDGEKPTRIVASVDWKLTPDLKRANPPEEYLLAAYRVENIAVRDLTLASRPEHRITGGFLARDVKGLELAGLRVREFRWAGLHVEHSSDLKLHHCQIENASLEKHGYRGGLIRTRWIQNSVIHDNRIIGGEGDGYGYKGSGHVNVTMRNNLFRAPYFAIESAHENEFGVEIHHNRIEGCVSIPKGGQGADPNTRGHAYSFWIHDNVMTDSYAIEGPRNHLRVDHNHIRVAKPGGRIYTHHGGINHGPIWIHHNVVENVDRAFVWMNEGRAENIHVFNNTVTFADAADRTGAIFGAWSGDRMDRWTVRNNVFVCPPEKPRALMPVARDVPKKILASNNLCVNVTAVPEGNFVTDPRADFANQGDGPWRKFCPRDSGNLFGRGEKIDLPFAGRCDNLGAVQVGDERLFQDVPHP